MRSMRSLVEIGSRSRSSRLKHSVLDALWHHTTFRAGIPRWTPRLLRSAVDGMARVSRSCDDPLVRQSLTMRCAEVWTKQSAHTVRSAVLDALGIRTAVSDPRSAAAIVDQVGEVALHSSNAVYFHRGVNWLAQEFREQTWGIVSVACHRPVPTGVLGALEDARAELIRWREEELQEANGKPEAKRLAPVA